MLEAQAHAFVIRNRLINPPNAKADRPITMKNGWPVRFEPAPAAVIVPAPASVTPDPSTFEEIEIEIKRLKRKMAEMREAAQINLARKYPEIKTIKIAVARRYGVRVIDMDSARRTAELVRPRMIAMYLAKELTLRSLPHIGRQFNRDHTTVLHAIRKIAARRLADPDLDGEIETLAAMLKPAE